MFRGTYKDQVLFLLSEFEEMTCQQITKAIIEDRQLKDNRARYLSGSISSILKKLRDKGTLIILTEKVGPRGGMIYKYALNIQT